MKPRNGFGQRDDGGGSSEAPVSPRSPVLSEAPLSSKPPMITVNDKDQDSVPLYLADNVETVKARIALKVFTTIPRYIVFEPFEIHNLKNVNAKRIQVNDDSDINLEFQRLRQLIPQLSPEELCLLWPKEGQKRVEAHFKGGPFKGSGPFKLKKEDIEKVGRANNKLLNDIKNLDNGLQRVHNLLLVYDPYPTLKFQVEKSTLSCGFLTHYNAIELLNQLTLSDDIPFAMARDTKGKYIYKIHRNIKRSIESSKWLEKPIEPNTIFVRVKNTNSYITFRYDPEMRIIGGELLYQKMAENESEDDSEAEDVSEPIIRFVLDSFQLKPENQGMVRQVRIKGVSIIPNILINRQAFLDYMLVDDIGYQLLRINELKTSALSRPKFQIYFGPKEWSETVPTTMILRSGSKDDPYEQDPNKGYIQLRISKVKNTTEAIRFLDMFTRVIRHYLTTEQECIADYKRLGISLTDFAPKPMPKALSTTNKLYSRLRKIAPDVFVTNYPTTCQSERQPHIIPDEEVDEWEQAGWEVMDFPKKGEGPIRNYVCYPEKHIERLSDDGLPDNYRGLPGGKMIEVKKIVHPYPGVFDNRGKTALENSLSYTHLPCCFKKENNKIAEYLAGEKKKSNKAVRKQFSLHSDNAVNEGGQGEMTKYLKEMFHPLVNRTPRMEYIRYGVTYDVNTLLHALCHATRDPSYLKNNNKNNYVAGLRRRLSQLPEQGFYVARQELYDWSTNKIRSELARVDTFLDSALWYRLLEEHFKCNIIVIESYNFEVNLEIPRNKFAHFRYKFDKTRKVVVLLKIWGSNRLLKVANNKVFPHYEIIGKARGEFLHDDDDFLNYFNGLYRTLPNVFLISGNEKGLSKIKNLTTFHRFTDDVTHQLLDEYGKCRGIKLRNELCFVTEPFPPLAVPLLTSITENSEREVDKWTRDNGYQLLTTFTSDSKVIGKSYVVRASGDSSGAVQSQQDTIYFLIKDGDPNDTGQVIPFPFHIPKSAGHSDGKRVTETGGRRNLFTEQRRIARFMAQYIQYAFSTWWEKNRQPLTVDLIDEFINDEIITDENTVYSLSEFPKEFGLSSPLFHKGKLIVNSLALKDKLHYILKWAMHNDSTSLASYHRRRDLDLYLFDTTEFNQHPDEMIFENKDILKQWFSKESNILIVKDELDTETTEPYFYFDVDLHPERVMIQNVLNGYAGAVYVAETWHHNRINEGYFGKADDDGGVGTHEPLLYIYDKKVSPTTQGDSKIKIIQYTGEEEKYAAVLLL